VLPFSHPRQQAHELDLRHRLDEIHVQQAIDNERAELSTGTPTGSWSSTTVAPPDHIGEPPRDVLELGLTASETSAMKPPADTLMKYRSFSCPTSTHAAAASTRVSAAAVISDAARLSCGPKVPFRECAARTGFQVLLESDCFRFNRKF
jgi:hypothetical protein